MNMKHLLNIIHKTAQKNDLVINSEANDLFEVGETGH